MELMPAQEAKEKAEKYRRIIDKVKILKEIITNNIDTAIQCGEYNIQLFFNFKTYPYEDYSYEVYEKVIEWLKELGYYIDSNIYLDKVWMYIEWNREK